MDIWVYSDESGVFDAEHERYYVFGGVIFRSRSEQELCSHRFSAIEKEIYGKNGDNGREIKAAGISRGWKFKLYEASKSCERFGVVLSLKDIDPRIFENKKTKQRFLDWAYRKGVCNKLRQMCSLGLIDPEDSVRIHFLIDEHTTATDGLYELRETLEEDLKAGKWNFEDFSYTEPIFKNLEALDAYFCNSKKKTLVRCADIIANRLLSEARENNGRIEPEETLYIFNNP